MQTCVHRHPTNARQDDSNEENFNEISSFCLFECGVLFKFHRRFQRLAGLLVAFMGVQLPCMVFIKLDVAAWFQTSFQNFCSQTSVKVLPCESPELRQHQVNTCQAPPWRAASVWFPFYIVLKKYIKVSHHDETISSQTQTMLLPLIRVSDT